MSSIDFSFYLYFSCGINFTRADAWIMQKKKVADNIFWQLNQNYNET